MDFGCLYFAAFLCSCLGLLLGVVAVIRIAASGGRVLGYGRAAVSIFLSAVALSGFLVVMFAVVGSRSERPSTAELDRALGRGKSAEAHGPNCRAIRAARSQRADLYKSDALNPIAERGDLTTHEQMHLIDVVIEDMSADLYRKEVLVRLARNSALTAEGRAYLTESLRGMSADVYRREVLAALRESPAPSTR